MTKTVYLFDAASGEFLHPYEAHESPVEAGIFHEPIHSTPTPPPELKPQQCAVFSLAEGWSVVADHRGEIWFDAQGLSVEVKTWGLPDGLTKLAPLPTPEQLAQTARADRDARIAAVQWRYERNARERRLGLPPTDDIATLDNFVQVLADVSKQTGFPADIVWPVTL